MNWSKLNIIAGAFGILGICFFASATYSSTNAITSFGRRVMKIGDYRGDVQASGKSNKVSLSASAYRPRLHFYRGDTKVEVEEVKSYFIPFNAQVVTTVEVNGVEVTDPQIVRDAKDLADSILEKTANQAHDERMINSSKATEKAEIDLRHDR
ncbi:MAG: hypothetical protein NT076_02070 [Candidatus Pacearchaeota archaeon]|nr:hypothetical protein [Candidatus Pacearchaeota archaeon]